MANEMDLGGVTIDFTGIVDAVVKKALPQLARDIETDVAVQDALAQALWPALQSRMLQYIRANVSTGTGTPAAPAPSAGGNRR